MSVRSYETIAGILKAVSEPTIVRTDVLHHHQPFDIPISQLLRLEKDRGIKHRADRATRSCIQQSQYGLDVPVAAVGTRQAHTQCGGCSSPFRTGQSLHSPRRQFSTHPSSRQPQPRRAPPPPPRKPPTLLRVRNDEAAAPTDLLSKISVIAKTGEEHNRQDKLEQEKLRNQRMREERERRPWWDHFKRVENQAKQHFDLDTLLATPLDYLNRIRADVRKASLAEIERDYGITERRVTQLRNAYRAVEKSLRVLRKEIDSDMKYAAAQGRKDFIWQRHLLKTGIGVVLKRVEVLESTEQILRQDLAELKYQIDWVAWNEQKLNYQAEEAIEANEELKSLGEIHHSTIQKFEDLQDLTARIGRGLQRLEGDLNTASSSVSRDHLTIYVKMLTKPYSYWATNALSANGHSWRRINRIALVASRMPELVNHSLLPFEISMLRSHIMDDNWEIRNLLKILSGKAPQLGHKITLQKATGAQFAYTQGMNTWMSEMTDFLQSGMLLLNPAMASEYGTLQFAALRPFYAYLTASQSSQSMLRKFKEVLKLEQVEYGPLHNSQAAQKWRSSALDQIDRFTDGEGGLSRSLAEAMTSFTYALHARVLSADSSKLREQLQLNLTQIAREAKTAVRERQAFQALSSTNLYIGKDTSAAVINPVRLRGNNDLYPASKMYPVEYVTSDEDITPALKSLLQEKVLGIEMLSHPGAYNPTYAVIASVSRVVIIECLTSSNFCGPQSVLRTSLFTQILEDPAIVKALLNTNDLKRIRVGKEARLEGVVTLDDRPISKHRRTSQSATQTIRGKVFVKDQFLKSLPHFLTDLAFAAVFNLMTFLNAGTFKNLAPLDANTRDSILHARDQLRSSVVNNALSGVGFGPVSFPAYGKSVVLENPNWGFPRAKSIPFKDFVTASAARTVMKAYPGLTEPQHLRRYGEALAAYYMYTTFGKDLRTIGDELSLENSASSILGVVDTFTKLDLMLHPADRATLQKAAKTMPPVSPLRDPVEHERSVSEASSSIAQKEQKEEPAEDLVSTTFDPFRAVESLPRIVRRGMPISKRAEVRRARKGKDGTVEKNRWSEIASPKSTRTADRPSASSTFVEQLTKLPLVRTILANSSESVPSSTNVKQSTPKPVRPQLKSAAQKPYALRRPPHRLVKSKVPRSDAPAYAVKDKQFKRVNLTMEDSKNAKKFETKLISAIVSNTETPKEKAVNPGVRRPSLVGVKVPGKGTTKSTTKRRRARGG